MSRITLKIFLLVLLAIVSRRDAHGQQPSPAAPPPAPPTWPEEIAKGYLPYRQLTESDFPIDNKAHPGMALWFQPFSHFYCQYGMKQASTGYVYAFVTQWVVFSGFDKNLSSRKSKAGELKATLAYIQTAFDLAELHAREFAAIQPVDLPRGTGESFERARADLDDRIRALAQTKTWDAEKEMEAFRKATNDGKNVKKMRQLSAEIKKRLAAIPSLNPPPATK